MGCTSSIPEDVGKQNISYNHGITPDIIAESESQAEDNHDKIEDTVATSDIKIDLDDNLDIPNDTRKKKVSLASAAKKVMDEQPKHVSYSKWAAVGKAMLKGPEILDGSDEKKEEKRKPIRIADTPTSKSLHDVAKLAVRVHKTAQRWETKKSNFVKTVHQLFDVTVAIMHGLRFACSVEVVGDGLTELTGQDYRLFNKFKFPPSGSVVTPPHPLSSEFEFKDYAPRLFLRIRQMFGIETVDYLNALAGHLPYIDFITNSKSGQFFFFTYNKQFLIKTMRQTESVFLRSFIRRYFDHVHKYPDSLLVKIFGMHRIKFQGNTYHFIIMQNVFHQDFAIHKRFDIKGSTVGRFATEAEKLQLCPVLKDFEFRDVYLRVGLDKAEQIVKQLELDSQLLADLEIMDYSLLVGIHQPELEASVPFGCRDRDFAMKPADYLSEQEVEAYRGTEFKLRSYSSANSNQFIDETKISDELPPPSQPFKLKRTLSEADGYIRSLTPEGHLYFVGVIDFLQRYNTKKRLEHLFKSMAVDGSQISAVAPSDYAERFVNFIRGHFI